MKIVINKRLNCYEATYSGDGSKEICDLFGQYNIPTAFTDKADPKEVLAQIKLKNPQHDVSLHADIDPDYKPNWNTITA